MDNDRPDDPDTTAIWQGERCFRDRDCPQMTTTEYITGDVWITVTVTKTDVKTRTTTQSRCMAASSHIIKRTRN